MSRRQPTNIPASVLQRLLTVSKSLQEDFTLTLARYAIERLLYRLSRSSFAHRFVLKGAMLMNVCNSGTLLPTLTYAGPVRGDVRGAVAALVAFCLIRRRHGRAREVMTDAVAS